MDQRGERGVAEVRLIAAVAHDRVAGRDGELPWSAPEDLRRFSRLTWGHAVIMGRRTWAGLGRPLVERQNIVLSRHEVGVEGRSGGGEAGVQRAGSLPEALALVEPGRTAWVIGGERPWREALPAAVGIYLTVLHRRYDGDTRFPVTDPHQWRVGGRIETEIAVDGSPCAVTYLRLDRVTPVG